MHLINASSPLIPLTRPLTPRSLNVIRTALSSVKDRDRSSASPPTHDRHAAVLIPFCNVKGLPGILFELRSQNLRSHSGEICFPGGRMDESDQSILGAALRETQEEIGISSDRVDVLGEIGPPEFNFRGDLCVWPFVGFVYPESVDDSTRNMSEDDALPSLDLLSLHSEMSSHEVAAAFHVPLAHLADSKRHRTSHFRDSLPYITVDVKDIVEDAGGRKLGVTSLTSESIDASRDAQVRITEQKRIEVWGLTGWYLSTLMRILHVFP